MDIKTTCPLGHECEKSTEKGIERCAWFIEMQGNHPQTGQPTKQTRCAIAWNPILAVEVTGAARSVASSIESHRDETNKLQNSALQLIASDKKV